jgi:Protein tyrosine/serine phosphatase
MAIGIQETYMIKKLTSSVLLLAFFFSCTEEKPDIRVECDLTPNGNYLIKWETFPPMEGSVKIYESSTPDSFNMTSPVIETEISRGFEEILAIRNLNRSYFKLIFDKKYSVITSERVIQLRQIYNFRDLGGYYNMHGKQIRWGKIYRSSSLAPPPTSNMYFWNFLHQDLAYMDNLGIKSLINLRTEHETYSFPCHYQTQNNYNIPLRGNPFDAFFHDILSGKMKRNDVIIYRQDAFSFFLENNSDYFTRIFDILLDESNYPVVLYCSLGIDRSGITTALILLALDISEETIISDFMLSNEQVDYKSFFLNSEQFPEDIQETMTALISANKETITYIFEKITKEYGSLDDYFGKELNLTQKKRERLKEILLY